MPTRRGLGVLAGSAICLLVGRILGVRELYVVAVAGAVLVLAAALSVRLSASRVAVRRHLSTSRARPGQVIEAAIDLRNDGRLTTGSLLATDACPYALRPPGTSASPSLPFLLPTIAPGTVGTVHYQLVPSTRGRWVVGPLALHMRDPFGVVERSRRYSSRSELLVYPRIEALPAGPRLGAHVGSGRSHRRRLLGSGDEFHTIREYRTGDDLRRVHWPSTARRQRLMVRQHEQAWAARATVMLDTRAGAHRGADEHSSFEAAVVAAASVLAHLDAQHYDTCLITTAERAAPPVASLQRHLERLAVVSVGAGQSLRSSREALRGSEGLLVAVLAPPAAPPGGDPEVRALLALGRRYGSKVALVPAGEHSAALVTLLRAARWRAATLERGLAGAWRHVQTQSTHRLSA